MKKIARNFVFLMVVVQFCFFYFTGIVYASSVAELSNQFLVNTGTAAGFNTNNAMSDDSLKSSIAGLINIVLSFIGLVFFILMLYGGIRWMTSAGNQKSIEDAKGILTNAVIGLIITVLSWAISFFILQSLNKAGITS
jgi:TRAP-type C4-dicarboxylate transport system permease small subunit